VGTDKKDFNSNPKNFELVENLLYNFTMCVWFKTSQATTAIVSVTRDGWMFDRIMGLRNGKPMVDVYRAFEITADLQLNDYTWHHFCYTTITGEGTTI